MTSAGSNALTVSGSPIFSGIEARNFGPERSYARSGPKFRYFPVINARAHFIKALSQLEEAVVLAQERPLSKLEVQGLIQAFEFTHELAWNTLKDFLEDRGVQNLYGSRDTTFWQTSSIASEIDEMNKTEVNTFFIDPCALEGMSGSPVVGVKDDHIKLLGIYSDRPTAEFGGGAVVVWQPSLRNISLCLVPFIETVSPGWHTCRWRSMDIFSMC